jgi:hypothetical protein
MSAASQTFVGIAVRDADGNAITPSESAPRMVER